METKFGFTKFSVGEFKDWVASISVSRAISFIQQHHTWSPNYAGFTGSNHFEMQRSMKNYHVSHNGWADIGQHFSIFPDGAILTGRPLNRTPACIYGNNDRAVCIENVGDFDAGKDTMTNQQKDAIIRATAYLAKRFSLNPVTTNNIVYHHWFDLNTGERRNGAGSTKSCPGTAFFGGNKVAHCTSNFLPLVQGVLGGPVAPIQPGRYGRVTSDTLNVRSGPGSDNPLADGQGALENGAVIRIFGEQGTWLKISNSKSYWVYGRSVRPVTRRTVNTDDSKVRSGPGLAFPVLSALMKNEEVFVNEVSGGWSKISNGETWISSSLLS